MKDKLFWIALIFAGFYFFNKMNSSQTSSTAEEQIERQVERQTENRQRPSEIEPNFGDKDKPLNLPQKDGQISNQQQNQSDYSNRNQNQPPTNSNLGTGEKDISLGDYGSIKLPKKDGASTTSNGNNSNQNTSTRSTEQMLVKLNPQTTIGDGMVNQIKGTSYAIFDGKSFQVTNSVDLNIYIDTGGFSAMTDCSNSRIYVKSSGQLMMTGNGRNNTIYYENGAEIRNGLADNSNNRFVQVREIVFD